jgi:hypothetical protein
MRKYYLRSGGDQEGVMRFEKGQSGNPGGRPKGDGEIRELAREHTEMALRTLAEIAERGENESARVAAANGLLDRGWGKPAVPIGADDLPTVITFRMGDRDLRPPKDVTPTADSRLLPTPRLPALDEE